MHVAQLAAYLAGGAKALKRSVDRITIAYGITRGKHQVRAELAQDLLLGFRRCLKFLPQALQVLV
jgi:hypothetical protein